LKAAIYNENVDIVKYLLSIAEIKKKEDWYPLASQAARSGNVDIAKLIIPRYNLRQLYDKIGFRRMFLSSVENGKVEVLNYLFPKLNVSKDEVLSLIEAFSLPIKTFLIPVQRAKEIFLFLVKLYFSIKGTKKKLKQTIEAILYEDVKDEEYTNFLKDYLRDNL
jgi:hypothetical protein